MCCLPSGHRLLPLFYLLFAALHTLVHNDTKQHSDVHITRTSNIKHIQPSPEEEVWHSSSTVYPGTEGDRSCCRPFAPRHHQALPARVMLSRCWDPGSGARPPLLHAPHGHHLCPQHWATGVVALQWQLVLACATTIVLMPWLTMYISTKMQPKCCNEIISKSKLWYSLRFGSVPKLNSAGYGLPPWHAADCYSDFSNVPDSFFLLHEYSFQSPAGGLWMIKTLVLVILIADQAYEISLSDQTVYYLPHFCWARPCSLSQIESNRPEVPRGTLAKTCFTVNWKNLTFPLDCQTQYRK